MDCPMRSPQRSSCQGALAHDRPNPRSTCVLLLNGEPGGSSGLAALSVRGHTPTLPALGHRTHCSSDRWKKSASTVTGTRLP